MVTSTMCERGSNSSASSLERARSPIQLRLLQVITMSVVGRYARSADGTAKVCTVGRGE